MTQKTITICDKCKEEVKDNEVKIDLGAYGVHLHERCFETMTAVELAIMIDIDGKRMIGDDWDKTEKLPSHYRRRRG